VTADIRLLGAFLAFAIVYFGLCLPVFQAISCRMRGRKFTIRLGGPWDVRDADEWWDTLMSVLSFIFALFLLALVLHLFFRFEAGVEHALS